MKNAKQKQLGLIIATILGMQAAYALPTGAQVVQGSASISTPNSATMNITNSNNAVINWQQFNIGAGQTTNFIQPSSSSSVLNRVISNNPSQILGNLNSNGQVFLINQHGILVGEGARINTNGFFASTLNITNEDFLNGNLKFSDGGFGDINNKGYIHAGADGNVVLIAPNIENGGVIEVENGNIILAAGKAITITNLNNSSVEFQVQAAEHTVTNLGSVIAKNGAANLFAGTLKHTGSIKASGLVRDKNGIIRLVALDTNEVSGSVDVTGVQGGYIEVLGDTVDVQDGANIDASGSLRAGKILIGGDQQGLNPNIKNATSTTLALGAQIHADGIGMGDGGRVILFAQDDVHVHGKVSAMGGQQEGDGGFIETSGLQQLDITVVPNATAPNGQAGEWLIDPNNITIVNSGVTSNIGQNGGDFNSTGDSAFLDVALITGALEQGTDVTITTDTAGANNDVGNINIARDIVLSASTPGNLTLNAHNNINVNANIDSSIGFFNLTLNANLAGNTGRVSFNNATINLGGGNLTLTGNSVAINNAVNFAGVRGQINLSAPFVINTNAVLTVAAPQIGGGASTTFVNNNGITNNGTFLVDGGCGDGCGSVVVDGVFNNNGIIDFKSGQLDIAGTLNLNAGGSIAANLVGNQFGPGEGHLNIANGGTLNVNVATTIAPALNFDVNGGTINDFHNLILPNVTTFMGGIVNFSEDIFGLYRDVNGIIPTLKFNDGVTTFNGSASGNYFLYTGDVELASFNQGFPVGLILNNTDLRLLNDVTVLTSTAAVTVNGTNGRFSLLGGSTFNQLSDKLFQVNVSAITNGKIKLTNRSSSLEFTVTGSGGMQLENGGSLEGIGTYVGNVTVGSGGTISPGLSGNGNDNTDTLNINGNVAFETGSLFQVEVDANGSSSDQLVVSNSAVINGGDAYFFWDQLTTANPDLFTFSFSPITSANISGAGFSFHDLPSYTSSNLGISGNNLQYVGGSNSGVPINFWTGSANDNNWSSAGNWFNGVPTIGQSVVIETNTVDVDVNTADIAFAQIDAQLKISGSSSISTSSDLFTLDEVDFFDASSGILGSGTWYNFDEAYFNEAGFTLSKNVVNYGDIRFSDLSLTTNDFIVSNTSFENLGSFLAYSASDNVEVDFSGSTSGLINKGVATFIINGSQTAYSGTLNNTGVVNFISTQNNQTKVIVNNAITNAGVFNLSNTVLDMLSGTTFSLNAGSSLNGDGELIVNNGASLQIQTATTLGANQKLTLNDGSIYLAQNLGITGVMDWNAGRINGTAGFGVTLTALSGSAINMAAGFNNNTLEDIDMSIAGVLNLASNGANLAVNENRFTVTESSGTANSLSILSSATLTGGGLIFVDQNSVINAANGTQFNPKLLVAGTANFFGGAGLTYLGLDDGFNATVNVNTNGSSSAGNTLNIQSLNWLTGSIVGHNTDATNLITSGTSALTSGNLTDINWLNQGANNQNKSVLNWQGTLSETLNLTNASLTNGMFGVINITSNAAASSNSTAQAKTIIGGASTVSLVNNGTINLINSTLDLGLGGNLVLGTNTSVLNGSGIITGDVINSNGSITIGNPLNLSNSGSMVINGNYTQGVNGSLQIRIVDPVNGQFSHDTFSVNAVNGVAGSGTANLDGTLRIAYFSNQVVSITESFNPFSFANRNGIFSTLQDTNGNILAIDFSNGGFTILGTSSQTSTPFQEILQSQQEFQKILKILEGDELNESLAFIKDILEEREEDEGDGDGIKRKRAARLVCR